RHPARGGDALRETAAGDGPQEARGAAAPDPAHPGRSRDLRADLGERLHPRLRAARGGSGAHADPRLPLLRAARRPPAQAVCALIGLTHPAAPYAETARSAAPPAPAR